MVDCRKLARIAELTEPDATFLAHSLSEWADMGFDRHDEVVLEGLYPDFIDVWLLRMPKGGSKDLLRLKSELRLDTSIIELYRGAQNLPYRLLHSVNFYYATRVVAFNETDNCLGIFEVDEPDRPVSIWPF